MLDAHVVKRRPNFTVDVALRVPAGASCGLFGVSGAGKSTVLGCIAGVETPDDGRVTAGETTLFPPSLALYRRPLGYLTQDADLFPHLRVDENVAFGVAAPDAQSAAWIAELRGRLELEPIWRSPAREISGGQARRVALARMLARRPPLVLLDEPFAGLDRHLVRDLLDALTAWQKTLGFTLVVVDHEAEVLERLCPRTVVIEEGRIVQDAPWAALREAPATPLLAALLAPL
jgi:ABC-type sulfate/molybdate transport systems ATPase subunit